MQINFQDHEDIIISKAIKTWIPNSDWEDIAQELRIHLWLKKDTFDPNKGASVKTFVNRVLDNKIRDFKKTANRKKRLWDTYHLTFSELEATEEGQWILDSALPLW